MINLFRLIKNNNKFFNSNIDVNKVKKEKSLKNNKSKKDQCNNL